MSLPNQVIESFHNASGVAFPRGSIVRATTGNRQTLLAQADTLGNLASILGVANNASGGIYNGVTAGEAECLLETGLTPAGGQIVYVSASVAGRGTTAAPTLAVPVGTIIDTSRYAVYGTVTISLFSFFSANDAASVANWDPALARYIFVDNQNGIDTNIGYIDAAPGTVFAAGAGAAVAIRTAEELRNRIPRVGASRILVVLFRPRSDNGNYLNKAGAADFVDFNYDGYLTPIFRGSNDFTNSLDDQYDSGGAIDATGPNGDGSWTVLTQVSFTITVAAGALPVENTLTGNKLQFKGNVTAAARQSGQTVIARSAATIFDTGAAQTLAPGDEFFFMTPGVRFTVIRGMGGRGGMVTGQTVPRNVQAIGFRFTSAISIYEQIPIRMEFCRFDSTFSVKAGTELSVSTNWRNESEVNINMRSGLDCRGAATYQGLVTSINMCAFHSTMAFINMLGDGSVNNSYYNGLCSLNGIGKEIGTTGGFGFVFGGFPGTRPSRFAAGIAVGQANLLFNSIDLDGSTSGIVVTGNTNQIEFSNVSGALTGGVISVIDLTGTSASGIVIGTGMTATPSGVGFEVVLAGPAGTTFASFATTNVVDTNGNDTQGSAGHVVDACKLVINKTGVAVTIGAAVRGNGTNNQVTSAFGNDAAVENSNVIGVMVTPALNDQNGYIAVDGSPVCNFDGVPTSGAIAYLSPTTTRTLTTTVPAVAANNNRLRVGRVISVVGTDARVAWHPENLGIVATGTP